MAKSGRPVIEYTDDTLREIASELQDKTIPEVAEKHGVSVPTMNKWIRKAKDAGYITRARVGNKPDSRPFTYHYLLIKNCSIPLGGSWSALFMIFPLPLPKRKERRNAIFPLIL